MLLGRRGRSRAATVADGAWEDEMRLLARKLSQHRDRPRHRFLGSQGLNYGWSNIFVNLCCSRIGASFDVAVALCQTMLSRLAPKASVFLSVFKGACVNLCCCQPHTAPAAAPQWREPLARYWRSVPQPARPARGAGRPWRWYQDPAGASACNSCAAACRNCSNAARTPADN